MGPNHQLVFLFFWGWGWEFFLFFLVRCLKQMSYHINLNLHMNFGFIVFSKIISRIGRDRHQTLDLFFGWCFTGCTMVNYHEKPPFGRRCLEPFPSIEDLLSLLLRWPPSRNSMLCWKMEPVVRSSPPSKKTTAVSQSNQVRPLKIGRIWPQEEGGSSPFAPKMPWKKNPLNYNPFRSCCQKAGHLKALGGQMKWK